MKSELHRSESFISTDVVTAHVSTRSGNVTVRTHDQPEVLVELSVAGAADQYLLDEVTVAFQRETNALEVRSTTREGFDGFRGLGELKDLMKKRSWFELHRHDVNVQVTLPHGSSVELATASGDGAFDGNLDSVKVTCASGDVVVACEIGSLDVRSASGDVKTVQVRDVLECRSASGDVHCSGAATNSKVHTASGDVVMTLTRSGEVAVRSVSGDVRMAVVRGLAVDVSGSSLSGDVASSIVLDESGDGGSANDTVVISVTTVSGDVTLDRASSGEMFVSA